MYVMYDFFNIIGEFERNFSYYDMRSFIFY